MLIFTFSCYSYHPEVLGFWASYLADIILTVANKLTCQGPSAFRAVYV